MATTDIVIEILGQDTALEVVVENGVPGARGFTGSRGAGYVGSAGAPGINGFTGSRGVAGINGFTGSRGLSGEYAAVGFTGSKGEAGSLGYTGSSGAGFTGSRGLVGFTGSRGQDGIGFVGSIGPRGFTGSVGGQGGTGFTGSKGATGGIGFTGSAGAAGGLGYTGSKGNDGIGFVGSKGDAGAAGYTGSKGAAGTNGGLGYTGSRGLIGYTGSGGGGGGSLTSVQSILSEDMDVNASSQNGWKDVISIELTAGTWLINTHITIKGQDNAANYVIVGLLDGSTVLASRNLMVEFQSGYNFFSTSLTRIYTVASTKTIKLRLFPYAGATANYTVKARTNDDSLIYFHDGATLINAVKIA